MEEIKYIIIPDVHGRDFWREAVKTYIDTDAVFIFLGDYLDPYPYEEIDNEYQGLLDIIEYKKMYPERFILLLGNHDLHYLTQSGRGSRWDRTASERNKKTFLDNINLFQIVYTDTVNDKKFLFSHAGILKDWIYVNHDKFNIEVPDENADYKINDWTELPDFNELFRCESTRDKFFASIGDISFHRGGYSQWGSIVWADVHEHLAAHERIPGVIQIFGHTQQEKDPINYDNTIYCLDCREPFALTASGNIVHLHNGEEIPPIDSEEEYKKELDRLNRFSAFFF